MAGIIVMLFYISLHRSAVSTVVQIVPPSFIALVNIGGNTAILETGHIGTPCPVPNQMI